MKDNHLYTDHNEIIARLSLRIKKKDFSEVEIMTWCQEVETHHIKDTNTMWRFLEVALETHDYSNDYKMVELPCNIYRLLDVYGDPNNPISHLESKFLNKDNKINLLVENKGQKYIYINYIGTPIDENGTPLIAKAHIEACITYCLMMLYYEDYLERQNPVATELERKFSGQMAHAKNSVRHLTKEHFNRLNVINGDMIESIGNMRTLNKFI